MRSDAPLQRHVNDTRYPISSSVDTNILPRRAELVVATPRMRGVRALLLQGLVGSVLGHASPTQFDNWEIHGQTTYIQQGYPAFRSPYLGDNSFTPWAQSRATLTASAFRGLRLWEDAELYYNPELLQSFGLHDTTGAAGFPNGEAQKSNFAYPATARRACSCGNTTSAWPKLL
jgi:hypothetical protein